MDICEFLHLNFKKTDYCVSRGRGRADRVHGEWGPRVSPTVHGGPGARGWRRSAPWVPRVSRTRGRGRLTAGPTWQPRGAPEGGLAGTADRRRRTRAPMVAAGDQRRGGAAPEREEGRGKRKGRSTAHPGTTRAAETTTGAEEGGGAARVDEDDGVPVVGGRNGGADGVGEDAAKPKGAMPK